MDMYIKVKLLKVKVHKTNCYHKSGKIMNSFVNFNLSTQLMFKKIETQTISFSWGLNYKKSH